LPNSCRGRLADASDTSGNDCGLAMVQAAVAQAGGVGEGRGLAACRTGV
jgi:hypothetical protein